MTHRLNNNSGKSGMKRYIRLVLCCAVFLLICAALIFALSTLPYTSSKAPEGFSFESIPSYCGEPSYILNGNVPYFKSDEITRKAFEAYLPLDSLGRCRTAQACLDLSLMPNKPREYIGMIKPSGWQTARYDDLITDKYLYNRCHLIAYSLSGENANEKNLITGTRYFNTEGMLPYETLTSEYIKSTSNHVMYRVSPVFINRELVARGVVMEAYSVEDKGKGLSFNVFIYNVQPGIEIDYKTGKSTRAE